MSLFPFLRPFLNARFAPRSGFAALTSKRGNKHFYKGKGARPTGRHTKLGGYRLLEWKLPDYIVPDLKNFELKPYVSYLTKAPPKTTA